LIKDFVAEYAASAATKSLINGTVTHRWTGSRERFHELLKSPETDPPEPRKGVIAMVATIEMSHGQVREIPTTMGNGRPSRTVKI
jgi:hypothetical protein